MLESIGELVDVEAGVEVEVVDVDVVVGPADECERWAAEGFLGTFEALVQPARHKIARPRSPA